MDSFTNSFNKELDDKIKELGEIEHIVAPNKYHYSYVLDWYKHIQMQKFG